MNIELTPERVMEMGKMWGDSYLSLLSVEQRLAGLPPEAYLSKLTVEQRLAGLAPAERLRGLKPQERLTGLKPEERLRGLKPQEVLSQFKPEEIEHYLNQIKPPNIQKNDRRGRS